jgi:hypothetical protein
MGTFGRSNKKLRRPGAHPLPPKDPVYVQGGLPATGGGQSLGNTVETNESYALKQEDGVIICSGAAGIVLTLSTIETLTGTPILVIADGFDVIVNGPFSGGTTTSRVAAGTIGIFSYSPLTATYSVSGVVGGADAGSAGSLIESQQLSSPSQKAAQSMPLVVFDPINGSDSNPGTEAAPLQHFYALLLLWGTSSPTFNQYTRLKWINDQPDATDPVILNDVLLNGVSVSIEGTLTQVATGTVGTFTPLVRFVAGQTDTELTDSLGANFTPWINYLMQIETYVSSLNPGTISNATSTFQFGTGPLAQSNGPSPNITLAGSPTGPLNPLQLTINKAGVSGIATFLASANGVPIAGPNTDGSFTVAGAVLVTGTGITATFPSGTYNLGTSYVAATSGWAWIDDIATGGTTAVLTPPQISSVLTPTNPGLEVETFNAPFNNPPTYAPTLAAGQTYRIFKPTRVYVKQASATIKTVLDPEDTNGVILQNIWVPAPVPGINQSTVLAMGTCQVYLQQCRVDTTLDGIGRVVGSATNCMLNGGSFANFFFYGGSVGGSPNSPVVGTGVAPTINPAGYFGWVVDGDIIVHGDALVGRGQCTIGTAHFKSGTGAPGTTTLLNLSGNNVAVYISSSGLGVFYTGAAPYNQGATALWTNGRVNIRHGSALRIVNLGGVTATSSLQMSATSSPVHIDGLSALGGPLSQYTADTEGENGTAGTITAFGSNVQTWTGLAGIAASDVGKTLVTSGAATAGNNSYSRIVAFLGTGSVQVFNPTGIATDANNGSIVWSVQQGVWAPGIGIATLATLVAQLDAVGMIQNPFTGSMICLDPTAENAP